MPFLLAIIMLFSAATAFASTCSEIDLSQSIETSVSVPQWSQGSTHLCYAFSAATLIDQYRFSHGDKDFQHQTSPLLLALKTIENFREAGSSFSGGKVEHAFSAARLFGSCSAKMISDRLGPYNIDYLLKTLQKFHFEFERRKENKIIVVEKIYKFLKSSGAKAADIPSSSEIEKNLSLDKEEFITRTLLGFCGENKNLDYLPTVKLLFQPRVTADQILERVHHLLSTQTPLGINFCSNVVTDPFYQGQLQGKRWYCKDNLNHSAVVVGRKIQGGKCQFLIQDTGCKGYKNPSLCRQGQYWLTADQLLNNTHGIFWLE